MLLSTPPLSPTQPNPTQPPPPRLFSPHLPTNWTLGETWGLCHSPSGAFCLALDAGDGVVGGGGYFTKLVSIQIANFHMVLADPKENVPVNIRWAPLTRVPGWFPSDFPHCFSFFGRNRWMSEWRASSGQVPACMWKLLSFLQLMEMSLRFHSCLNF